MKLVTMEKPVADQSCLLQGSKGERKEVGGGMKGETERGITRDKVLLLRVHPQ